MDINTAWALWALNGTWDSRSDPGKYTHYVDWSERMAHKLSCRSDDIERALFGAWARRPSLVDGCG